MPGKPDWNAGLVPPSPSCAQGCRRSKEVDMPQHSCRTGDCFYSKVTREGPSAVNVTNEYLTPAYLRDKEEARDYPLRPFAETYADKFLLGEWKPTELKPCPFCGSTSVKENTRRKSCVECMTCGAEGPTGREADRAIELWNTRSQSGSVPQSGA